MPRRRAPLAIARPLAPALLLSLERLRRIEEIDAAAGSMTVQAGATGAARFPESTASSIPGR